MKKSWTEQIEKKAERYVAKTRAGVNFTRYGKVYRVEIYGPCCCGSEGLVSDGYATIKSPAIPCTASCSDVMCNHGKEIDRELESRPLRVASGKGLRALKDKVVVEGFPFSGRLLAKTVAGLPGDRPFYTVRDASDAYGRYGFMYLQGTNWRAIVQGMKHLRAEAPRPEEDVDLETLTPPARKTKRSKAEMISAAIEKITKEARSMARDQPGLGQTCRCNGHSFSSDGIMFVSGKAKGDEPECFPSMCRLRADAAHRLGQQTIRLSKLRAFVQGRELKHVRIGDHVYVARNVRKMIDGLGSGPARIAYAPSAPFSPDLSLVLGDPDGEWVASLAPVRTGKEDPAQAPIDRVATLQDLAGLRR